VPRVQPAQEQAQVQLMCSQPARRHSAMTAAVCLRHRGGRRPCEGDGGVRLRYLHMQAQRPRAESASAVAGKKERRAREGKGEHNNVAV